MFSRSKQLEEVETAVLEANSNCDDTVSSISSASPVKESTEPRSKRTIRRPAYWLEMRGMKNSVNKSSEENGIYHCQSKAKLIFFSVFSVRDWFVPERHAAIQPKITSLLVLLMYQRKLTSASAQIWVQFSDITQFLLSDLSVNYSVTKLSSICRRGKCKSYTNHIRNKLQGL